MDEPRNGQKHGVDAAALRQWISVKDEMPKRGQLIAYANCYASGPRYGVLRVPKWETDDRYDFWMPIPEPPHDHGKQGETV